MIIVQLNGGLGNQLFQYAAAKSLALHHDVPLRIDISAFKRKNLPELEVSRDFELYNFQGVSDETIILSDEENQKIIRFLQRKSFSKLLPNHKRKIYSEPFYHFDKNFFDSRKNVLLRGQWQSERYFVDNKNLLLESLRLKPHLLEHCLDKGAALANENSVSVHVRRADYMRKQIIFDWHGVMEKEYYIQALETLKTQITGVKVYYFTDDIRWVEGELAPLAPGEIISSFTRNHYEDFYLISQCKHNIIANSSFSWWGAWLNKNPKKIVIGPKRWFDKGPKDTYDILPESWLKI